MYNKEFLEYHLNRFKEFLKSHSINESLILTVKDICPSYKYLVLKFIVSTEKISFEVNETKRNYWKYVFELLQGKLEICPICGKRMLSSKKTCSRECGNKFAQQTREKNNLEKYGVKDNFHIPEIREKIKKTILEKFDVEYPTQSPEVIKTRKKNNLKKYGVEETASLESVKEKIFQTNYERYARMTESQKHIQNYELLTEKYTKENFIKDSKFLIDDFLDFFNLSPKSGTNYKRRFNITQPNKTSTIPSKPQQSLFEWIPTENKVSNTRQIIKPYELDIYLPDIKLAIEYNGSYWHSDKNKNYHLNKTELCNEKGIQLFHIFDFDNLDIWKSMISNKLGLNTKIYARKCIIKELEYKEVKDFLNINHLQGTCNSKINLGLFYNDELVEVMTFGKPRFNKNYDYELLRLCTKKYYSVIGGASKLFNYFLKNYKGSIISYANRRFSNGNIYRQLGFTELKKTEPNYWYADGKNVYSRYKCQKHKLPKLLKTFKQELSEFENMTLNGYLRIYDCGNIVFSRK